MFPEPKAKVSKTEEFGFAWQIKISLKGNVLESCDPFFDNAKNRAYSADATTSHEGRSTPRLHFIECLKSTPNSTKTSPPIQQQQQQQRQQWSKPAALSELYRAMATQDIDLIWPFYTYLYHYHYHKHLSDHTYRQLFNFAANGKATQRNLNRLLALVEDMKERAMQLRMEEYHRLIHWVGGYTVPQKRSHHLTEALALFDEMQQYYTPSRVVYNTLIHIASQLADVRTAQRLYHDMIAHDIQPDGYTYAILLSSMGQMGDREGIDRMMAELNDHDAIGDTAVWNAAMAGYATQFNGREKMEDMFDAMLGKHEMVRAPEADAETFRIYLQMMLKEGDRAKALALLKDMHTTYHIQPNLAIYNAFFESYVGGNGEDTNDATVRLDELRWLYEHMRINRVRPNSETMHRLVSALLDYGDIKGALRTFVQLSKNEAGSFSGPSSSSEDPPPPAAPEQLQGLAVRILTKRRHVLEPTQPGAIEPNQELLDRLTNIISTGKDDSGGDAGL
ncbi:hypothetical protein BX666DRAFT_2027052 [Dichotomocladium elegans]|nr:hypothetical protein BX666DRAFT_2027052 [Dichotomocladium elegans]